MLAPLAPFSLDGRLLLQRVLSLPPFLRCAAAAFDELKIVIKLRLLSLHLKIIIINKA